MPTVSDISFECPHCQGPLVADLSHVGMSCDCPHCYVPFQVPDASAVNKDKFIEPKGLRRVLKQVRDQEWEMLRRNLRAAKAHNAELESELHRVQALLADRATVAKPAEDKAAEEKNAELSREIEQLRGELVEAQSKLEAEQAKVLVMEAAGISADLPVQSKADEEKEVLIQQLQSQLAELRKSNDGLRAARDKVHAEFVELKEQCAVTDEKDQHMEVALGHLGDRLHEVLELVTARRALVAQRA